ncbi:MAG: SOS response-associated peptidase, partial [Myxococcota bacterium]|nr:SOS response-associated peptidase [Myxococcota bacterium]
IHDRMPLIVECEGWARWLDPALTGTDAIAAMLSPRTPPLLVYAVSTHVNDPAHDDARCVEPFDPVQRGLFA